ncbi:MAG: FAD:protein FMN transferase [Phycisphaerales bacterium]|nr:MAG: FAD:protein FMN transferase [Phycisphaerales bacterium]
MNVRLATEAMGTRFEVVLTGDDPPRLRTVGEAAIEEIEDWHRRLSLFEPGSLLSYLNRHAADRPVKLDDDTFELLVECIEVHAASQGAFDITVAPIMRAWGFHKITGAADSPSSTGEDTPTAAPVGSEFIQLDVDRRTIRFLKPGMAIDLGGLGKGHALDAAAAVLRENGVECGLLHGGTSTVVALGSPPDEDGWRVALKQEGPSPVVTLRDAALSVSAPHGRTIHMDGERLGHIIDPNRGSPARGTQLAAVVGPTARQADAWSTALLVLGHRPPGLEAGLTTLIAGDERADPRWKVEGPECGIFSIPDCLEEATETTP